MVEYTNRKRFMFLILFVILLVITFYMIRPYFTAILFGALVTYFMYPLYKRIINQVKSRMAARIILSAMSLILIVVLVMAIVFPLATQAQSLYQRSGYYVTEYLGAVEECAQQQDIGLTCKIMQSFGSFTKSEAFSQASKEVVRKVSLFFYQSLADVITGIAAFLFFVVITVFSIYYFLDHGPALRDQIVSVLPLTNSHKRKIVSRLEETISAVIKGNISTALLQGIAGGVIFFLLGVPAPLFWGLIMAILAFIPIVGPALVWIPVVILFFIQGSVVKAIILLVYALLVMGAIDNILKPRLIGGRIQLSTFAVFLGVIGGIQLFGILGFFFGPIVIALLVTSLQIYKEMDHS